LNTNTTTNTRENALPGKSYMPHLTDQLGTKVPKSYFRAAHIKLDACFNFIWIKTIHNLYTPGILFIFDICCNSNPNPTFLIKLQS